MEISKSSKTYRRFIAGRKEFIEFLGVPRSPYNPSSVNFCCMMRTIYFWRPFICLVRSFLMAATILIPVMAFSLHFPEMVASIILTATLAGLCFAMAKIAVKIERSRSTSDAEPNQVSLLGTWIDATHDKICPVVRFKEGADVKNS